MLTTIPWEHAMSSFMASRQKGRTVGKVKAGASTEVPCVRLILASSAIAPGAPDVHPR
jgi:hypothetical protein